MLDLNKKITPAIFSLVIVCFFLPFVTVSCQEQPIVTLSGMELVTGKTIQQMPNFPGSQQQPTQIPGNPLATFAFVSTCAGVGTGLLLKSKQLAFVSAIIGAVNFVTLLVLKLQFDDRVVQQGKGVLRADYGFGFWMSFLLFLSAALINAYFFITGKKKT